MADILNIEGEPIFDDRIVSRLKLTYNPPIWCSDTVMK